MLEDVPNPIDLRLMSDARAWEQSSMEKRPYRAEFFAKFTDEISVACPTAPRILELGSGPGFLAEHILRSIPDASCVLLDFSPAMHELARARLVAFASRAEFIERSFKEADWESGLGTFPCIVTNQAVHELRNKRHASTLHAQVRTLLKPGGSYLVCDHFVGENGVTNEQLFMTVEEQREALLFAGFKSVRQVLLKGSLVLHHAT
ncbi:class I SAM-dependent methyltransferase [Herminiimonas arsenitoxidans]|uniref:class I SAM-dependent methyltransferase n=1 Tax=Herminiimonas arsenitoxidans TaxID=1809410 RepID=UPI000970735F|nr:class I SAM-dependent methyltransferase [Herminiimonas arsenitoxidans]